VTRRSFAVAAASESLMYCFMWRKGREDAVLVWSKESHYNLFNVPRFWRVLTSYEIIQYWADKNSHDGLLCLVLAMNETTAVNS
jgi:hypothetical protein